MTEYTVWGRFIRFFHITIALGFFANATFFSESGFLHNWIGYALAGLVVMRVVWGLIGPKHSRFSQFVKGRPAVLAQINDIARHARRTHLGHSPLGGLMILNLLGTILAICATGVLLSTDAPANWIGDVHEALVGWASFSIAVHVLAVFWESLRTQINLPAAIFTGRKRVPDTINIIE